MRCVSFIVVALVCVVSARADPELVDALQTRMGLRLETQRRPVETLVIDGASLPAEN